MPDAARLLNLTLGLLARGPGDPSMRRYGQAWWRATRTPAGPALGSYALSGADVVVEAWGPGGEWLLDQAPALLGLEDDLTGFEPHRHPLVAEANRRLGWLRLGRTNAVLEALAPASIEQVVTGKEAFRAIRLLAHRFGDLVPVDESSPAHGLRIPLSAEQWLSVPSWEFLKAGVEDRRRIALLAGAKAGKSLERLATPAFTGDVDQALQSLPRVGPWTSAVVRHQALGDPDAWSVGDYHIGDHITYAFLGEKLGDSVAEELLEPFRGHRYRVERLVLATATSPERHGPRKNVPTHLPR